MDKLVYIRNFHLKWKMCDTAEMPACERIKLNITLTFDPRRLFCMFALCVLQSVADMDFACSLKGYRSLCVCFIALTPESRFWHHNSTLDIRTTLTLYNSNASSWVTHSLVNTTSHPLSAQCPLGKSTRIVSQLEMKAIITWLRKRRVVSPLSSPKPYIPAAFGGS